MIDKPFKIEFRPVRVERSPHLIGIVRLVLEARVTNTYQGRRDLGACLDLTEDEYLSLTSGARDAIESQLVHDVVSAAIKELL